MYETVLTNFTLTYFVIYSLINADFFKHKILMFMLQFPIISHYSEIFSSANFVMLIISLFAHRLVNSRAKRGHTNGSYRKWILFRVCMVLESLYQYF